MFKTFAIFLWVSFFGVISVADLVVLNPVSVSQDMPTWSTHLDSTIATLKNNNHYTALGYTECAEAKEVPSTFLCFPSEKSIMNAALTRASIYSEGTNGVSAGTLIRLDDDVYARITTLIEGHDIPSTNLAGFVVALQKACAASNNDVNVCPNPSEKEIFDKFIVPLLNQGKPFVLITTHPTNSGAYTTIVSHEILHAQYFLNPTYRATVDNFWKNNLTLPEQNTVKDLLSEYDRNNEYVIRNEFQAYLLMNDAVRYSLGSVAQRYSNNLRKSLQSNGAPAVQIINRDLELNQNSMLQGIL